MFRAAFRGYKKYGGKCNGSRRYAASDTAGPVAVSADDNLHILVVDQAGGGHGGDVDVEGGVFFGNAGPDLLDGGQLGGAEGGGVAVEVESGGLGDTAAVPALGRGAHEIQIDGGSARGVTVELRNRAQRRARHEQTTLKPIKPKTMPPWSSEFARLVGVPCASKASFG